MGQTTSPRWSCDHGPEQRRTQLFVESAETFTGLHTGIAGPPFLHFCIEALSNSLESDYISINTPDTALSLSYLRLPPVGEVLLTLNDDGVTKQCMCSCQLSILLSQIDL